MPHIAQIHYYSLVISAGTWERDIVVSIYILTTTYLPPELKLSVRKIPKIFIYPYYILLTKFRGGIPSGIVLERHPLGVPFDFGGFMRNSNITRVDSKGRILIPIHIRKMLGADDSTEIIIIPEHDRSQVRMLPLVREKTAEIRIMMKDMPGSLAHIANSLAIHNVNIMMSESRTIVKGKSAEWDVIVDTSEANGNMESLKGELEKSKDIRKVEILRK